MSLPQNKIILTESALLQGVTGSDNSFQSLLALLKSICDTYSTALFLKRQKIATGSNLTLFFKYEFAKNSVLVLMFVI